MLGPSETRKRRLSAPAPTRSLRARPTGPTQRRVQADVQHIDLVPLPLRVRCGSGGDYGTRSFVRIQGWMQHIHLVFPTGSAADPATGPVSVSGPSSLQSGSREVDISWKGPPTVSTAIHRSIPAPRARRPSPVEKGA